MLSHVLKKFHGSAFFVYFLVADEGDHYRNVSNGQAARPISDRLQGAPKLDEVKKKVVDPEGDEVLTDAPDESQRQWRYACCCA